MNNYNESKNNNSQDVLYTYTTPIHKVFIFETYGVGLQSTNSYSHLGFDQA